MSNSAIIIGGIQKENLYVVKELLEIIPVSKSHLYKSMRRYKVPCIRMSRRYLYLGKDILIFLEKLRKEDGVTYGKD